MGRLVLVLLMAALGAAGQGNLLPVDEAGYQTLLASQKGKVVLVDFWATWCVPCRIEMPKLVAVESKLRSRGFKWITISADEPEQEPNAVKFLSQLRVPGPAYVRRAKDDDKFINSIDPKWSGALPALFLYDKTGRKVKSFIGENPTPVIEAAINKLLR